MTPLRFLAVFAGLLIGLSVVMLERGRAGLEISDIMVGTTPATLYQRLGAEDPGPMVVVAHGFAGSRPIMQAYSFNLAQAGYQVLAFDFQGHGRNPVPMSGDVTQIDGTTARLIGETRRLIAKARDLSVGPIAVLGQSMATDVLIRAALAEADAGTPLRAVVAISAFSQAITAQTPPRLLMISGAWEPGLRAASLAALRAVQSGAKENQTVTAPGVIRRAAVAPGVEHVGVLFSQPAIIEARAWLDRAFDRASTAPIYASGLWVLVLLASIVALFRPVVALLPGADLPPPQPLERPVTAARFWWAILAPAAVVPLVVPLLHTRFLPVLVADYLLVHLAVLGLAQLVILRVWSGWDQFFADLKRAVVPCCTLVIWGIVAFGLALDRYAASFWPTPERLAIIALLALGTVPFMVADSYASGAGRGGVVRRIAVRVSMMASLAAAAMIDPDRLIFLIIVLPVLLLFFMTYGMMGRWVAPRFGALSAGLGLGLVLAWSLGVSFPLFDAG